MFGTVQCDLDAARLNSSILEVQWEPPSMGWTKCNSDGTNRGKPGEASCGSIFRDYHGSSKGYFGVLGISTALEAKLLGAITAMETTLTRGWTPPLSRM